MDRPSGDLAEDAPFRLERREYVRQETIVDRNDEGIITDPLGAERTHRCLSRGGHDVDDR